MAFIMIQRNCEVTFVKTSAEMRPVRLLPEARHFTCCALSLNIEILKMAVFWDVALCSLSDID
jgi:hypothetical protein